MGLPANANAAAPVTPKTYIDAQGNVRDAATGAILVTAANAANASTSTGGGAGGDPNGVDTGILQHAADAAAPVLSPLVDTVGAPFVGGTSAITDTANGQYGQALGDLAYGATRGLVGNNGGNTKGLINPNVINDAGQAIKGGGNAVGDLVSGLAPGGGSGPDASGLTADSSRATGLANTLENDRYNLSQNPTQAPQSPLVQLDQTNIDPARQRQLTALDTLQRAADGSEPSAAEILGKDQANRAAAQAYGNAAALQGGNSSGGTLRQALDAQTQIQGDANTQLIANRAKEMSDARNQLVTGLGNYRGQESTDATTNANLDQNKNLANTTAAVQTHGQDVTEKGDLITGENTSQATGVAADKSVADNATAKYGADQAYKGAIVGGAAGVVGKAIGAISDRRAKTNVKEADLVDLAESIPGKTWDYKDEANGPGRRVGVMAHDLQKSKAGKQLVDMGDEGMLVIDGANGLGAALAMSAEALRKAEAARKGRK